MPTSTRTTSGAKRPAINPANDLTTRQNYERERVFNLFRQYGYLESELNPLGLLPPQPHPDLEIDNEWAREARRIYCGSVGVEFMHIADPERRRWIQERIEADPAEVDIDKDRALDLSCVPTCLNKRYSSAISATSASRSRATRRLLPAVDQVLDVAGERGAVELVMGMSHRGTPERRHPRGESTGGPGVRRI